MVGKLTTQRQSVALPSLVQPGRRLSLLDVANRDVMDEGAARAESKQELKNAKAEFSSIKEQIRSQPFQAAKTSPLDYLKLVRMFDNNPFYRGALKNGIRDTNKNTHEWIPCQLMTDAVLRDSLMALAPGLWTLMQVHLRTATSGLIFNPDVVPVLVKAQQRDSRLRQPTGYKMQKLYKNQHGKWEVADMNPGDEAYLLQGHEGAMKKYDQIELTGYTSDLGDTKGWLCYGSTEFHNQLLYAFDAFAELNAPGDSEQRKQWQRGRGKAFLSVLYQIANAWMWDPAAEPPGRRAFVVPFTAHEGKGKERVSTVICQDNFDRWLTFLAEARINTLKMFELSANGLDMMF